MRRDNTNIAQDDNLAWTFDTFYDRRNGFLFEVNAVGGRIDAQTSNDGRANFDWNPVWQVETARFDGGWTIETAIPFKSLRYRPGPSQVWGFNLRRRNRWKNELSYLRPVPAIRKLVWIGGIDYIENGRGQLETREGDVGFTVELENSDQFGVRYARSDEHLLEPFPITEEISIPTGSYAFDAVQVQIVLGAQRAASGRIRLEHAGAAARATPHREPGGGGEADPAVPLLTPGPGGVECGREGVCLRSGGRSWRLLCCLRARRWLSRAVVSSR